MPVPQPLVSVVTPVYNGARFLPQCIDSVRAQTYRDWEHVVVDNCSSDATSEILDRYAAREPRVRVYRNPALLPVIDNHNAAVAKISPGSRYVQILHADDWLAPRCLERTVAAAERHPRAALVGARAQWGNRAVARELPPQQEAFSGRDIARRVLLGDAYLFWSPSALLLRRSVLDERGGLYRSSDLHADVQCYYEILEQHDFAFVHELLYHVRAHADSVTSREAGPFNKLLASNLDLLTTYGPRFLTADELAARRADHLLRYYRFLAGAALEARPGDFWTYHRRALARAGCALRYHRLVAAVAAEMATRPRRSLRRLLRGLRARWPTPPSRRPAQGVTNGARR